MRAARRAAETAEEAEEAAAERGGGAGQLASCCWAGCELMRPPPLLLSAEGEREHRLSRVSCGVAGRVEVPPQRDSAARVGKRAVRPSTQNPTLARRRATLCALELTAPRLVRVGRLRVR